VGGRLLALAAATLIGGLALVHPPVTRAADTGLQLVAQTTYAVLPAEGRVHVTMDAVATNVTPDPAGGQYYYTGASFTVQPAIANLRATSSGVTLAARISQSTSQYTVIDIPFSRDVFHAQSYRFTVTFDITDPGGAPQRDVRVSKSFAAFPVWAFGSDKTPGGSVTVAVPAGYIVTVETGTMTRSTAANGGTVLKATSIPDPYSFFAYVTAEGPNAFSDVNVEVPLPSGTVPVLVQPWQDDPQWGTRVADLMVRGIPELQRLIGLPYEVPGRLAVEEAASARLGDYAGIYNDTTKTIDIRYDADGITALHEAAHIWFNARLLSDRWIGEAWAEWYAVQAATQLNASGQPFTLTSDLLQHKIPLNAWGAIGSEDAATEDFAYAASYELAGTIASRTDIAGLQAVWQAAAAYALPYQPVHAAAGAKPETAAPRVDGWQRLLDLLENRTGASYTDLWAQWVVTPSQQGELTARSKARTDYQATVTAAGDWELPRTIRDDMSNWQFTPAEQFLAAANGVLAERTEIVQQATSLGLTPPTTLRAAFEGNASMSPAQKEADAELAALAAIRSADSAIAHPLTPLEWVGLLFASPADRLTAARQAFQQGDATAASSDAASALTERTAAEESGRDRVLIGGGGLLATDGLLILLLIVRRRRIDARRAAAVAGAHRAQLAEAASSDYSRLGGPPD
jgi:hypothetical protein